MKPNPNILSVKWSNKENDFIINYPRRCDGALIRNTLLCDILAYRMPSDEHKYPYNYVIENLCKELEDRGYDLKTLKFSIKIKED